MTRKKRSASIGWLTDMLNRAELRYYLTSGSSQDIGEWLCLV